MGTDSTDRIQFKLGEWKKQLIDLSLRNKLLNYRPTKRTTVKIVDERPYQILRQLLEGQVFEFDPQDQDEKDSGGSEQLELIRGNEGEDFQFEDNGETADHEADKLAYTGEEAKAERHRDNRLQTDHTEKKLRKNLTAIYRKTSSSLEEEGVNTLTLALGMLEWYEDPNSDTELQAPLILVPVELNRDTAASPFQLALRPEEPILNPAIQLRVKQDFDIDFPDLPELTAEVDVRQVFDNIQQSISAFNRWRITKKVVLGEFSFHKFLMYRDLDEHEKRFRENSLVRSICRENENTSGGSLDAVLGEHDLNEVMSPWETVQILDADSSQQEAMLAVREGHDVVIEGPPGTGKSQTIANIIADQLAEGRTVLFVSEKMAALEVVKDRLDDKGLGSGVLELHSNKAKKTEVVGELRRSLNCEYKGNGGGERHLKRLEKMTTHLQQYVEELHRPVEPLSWSPFETISRLSKVEEYPYVEAPVHGIDEVKPEEYEKAVEDLSRMADLLQEIGTPEEHPLRGLGLVESTRQVRRKLRDTVDSARDAMQELAEAVEEARHFFGLTSTKRLGGISRMIKSIKYLINPPGTEMTVLKNEDWIDRSEEVEELLERGYQYECHREQVERCFGEEIFTQELPPEIEEYRKHLQSGWMRFIKPKYWKLRAWFKGCLASDYEPKSETEFYMNLVRAARYQSAKRWITNHEQLGKLLYGSRWNGLDSDWDELASFTEWILDFRQSAVNEFVTQRGFEHAAEADLDREKAHKKFQRLRQGFNLAVRNTRELIEVGNIDKKTAGISPTADTAIDHLEDRLREIGQNLDTLRSYTSFRAIKHEIKDGLASDYMESALEGNVPPEDVVPCFKRLFCEKLLEKVVRERPALDSFSAKEHEKRISTFRELDEHSKDIAKEKTKQSLAERRKQLMDSELEDQLHRVQKEAKKQTRIMPIRKLLNRSSDVIQLLKPCCMMSPLSVAKYMKPSEYQFDVLIFDEASQIPPADAVGPMIRANQVVVVGDEKQLPPTQFFGVARDGIEDWDDENRELLEDMESVLKQVSISGIPSVRLRWHYRSEHESLIRFSNEEFYKDEPLHTFPHPNREDNALGLQFRYLEDATYEGRGQNSVEAEVVADAVVQHIHDKPNLSLGVGTFGMAQQRIIQDELDKRRREEPKIEWFFRQSGEQKFFIKNLENIQGDDRDVIFLSVTYGPNKNGKINRNFGPINRSGGWRRLNVITTRARKQLVVFSSMRGDDIDRRGINRGAKLLRKYLKYAESGNYPRSNIQTFDPQSPFEVAVKNEIEQMGYEVVPQVGESGYRIDLGVLDPSFPGRFLCGIECDGASYHRAATVRDRDRIRQQVLEDRGWDIHRVWSTDWFYDRKAEVNRLSALIEESKEKTHKQREQTGNRGRSELSQNNNREDCGLENDENDIEEFQAGPGLADDNKTPIEEVPVSTYQIAEPRQQGDKKEFYDASPDCVRGVVLSILKQEGPLAFSLLAQRVASAWQFQQTGKKIRKKVKSAVNELVSMGKAKKRNGFVSLQEMNEPPVRSRGKVDMKFGADDLPPSEVEQAIRVLLKHRGPLLPENIPSETARLLGFKRTGQKLRSIINNALERLKSNDELIPKGCGMALSE